MRFAYEPIGASDGHSTGRKLLARLYREETGQPLPEIVLTKYGQPVFSEGNYHFSISHTEHFAFCALDTHPVGLDAEELGRHVGPHLWEKVLSPSEKEQYLAAEDSGRAILTFWVLKEAYYKLLGTGLQGYPNRTNFKLTDDRVREIDGCLVALLQETDHAV